MDKQEDRVFVQEVSKEYCDVLGRKKLAVDKFSFSCGSHEIFGVVGANGAGKTTTLKMMATLLHPTGGEITINDVSVTKEPIEVRKHLGFHSGETELFPKLTVLENLRLFAEIYQLEDSLIKERVELLVKEMRLGDFKDQLVETLSTGMKQRVSLARVVVHDPQVIILDEPTSGLDVLSTRDLHELLSNLRDQGKTIIFSTHHMSEVESLCDRIVMIHEGCKLGEGTVEDICQRTQAKNLREAFLKLVEPSSWSQADLEMEELVGE